MGWDPATTTSKLIDRTEEPWVADKTKQVQKNRLMSKQPIYQSPIMYSNLKKGNLRFNVDAQKEDAFATGLTLLEAGNGTPVQNIYDDKKGEVDPNALMGHVQNFQARYGQENPTLVEAVTGLAQFDEAKRATARDTMSRLPPYDQYLDYL